MDYYATQAFLSGVFDLVAALGVATLTTAYLADALHPKSKERVAAWKKRKRARGEALWMPELTRVAVPAPAEETVETVPEPVVAVVPEPIAELAPEPVAAVLPEPGVEAEPELDPLAPPQALAIPTAVQEPQVLEQILEPALQPLPAALQQAELERVEVSQEAAKVPAQVEQNLDDGQ